MVAAPQLDRITVGDAVSRYMEGVHRAVRGESLSRATADNYARDLDEFVDIVGAEVVLDDLTGADIDDALLVYASRPDARFRTARPDRTRGTGAQARFRASINRLFTEAVLEGWVQASPMPRSRIRPVARGLAGASRRALSAEAASHLIDTSHRPDPARRDQQLGLRDAFILRVCVEAGPRVSELCGADQADLARENDGGGWLRVTGKGRKERFLPLTPETVAAYDTYVRLERPTPKARRQRDRATGEMRETVPVDDAEKALLLTWRGLRMTPRDVQLMVNRACRSLPAQIRRDVTPHGLRHTAATLLLASGAADVRTVKELLGHASISTTGIYLDSEAHELMAAVNAHPVTGRRASLRT